MTGAFIKFNAIRIHHKDNVAIALEDIKAKDKISLQGEEEFIAVTDIPYSHKVALRDITKGEDIIKYGEVIGQAAQDIAKGEWVHNHNLEAAR